jgi:pimeloyl-ACP methyl ester carboxylesterase
MILSIRQSGHSFGGYLTAAYALKHPERLKSAILADPWGMAPRPADIKERFNIPFWVGIIFRNCTPSKLGILEASRFFRVSPLLFCWITTLLKFVQFLAIFFKEQIVNITLWFPSGKKMKKGKSFT